MQYNAEIELGSAPEFMASVAEDLVDRLNGLHAAAGRGPSGKLQLTLTIEASSIECASGLAWSAVHETTDLPVFSFAVLPTVEFDRRYGLTGIVTPA